MSQLVKVQLTFAGGDTGPFNIYSEPGHTLILSGVSKIDLINGISITVDDLVIGVSVESNNGLCHNSVQHQIIECIPSGRTIFLQGDNNKNYLWNPLTDSLLEVILPEDSQALNVTFTSNKIWKFYKEAIPNSPYFNQPYIKEWNFNINTGIATYNRTLTFDIPIPDYELIFPKAFYAISDNELIISYSTISNSKDLIWTATLPSSPSTVISPVASKKILVTDMFKKDSLLLANDNKLLAIGIGFYDVTNQLSSDCNYPWLAQYNYQSTYANQGIVPEYIGQIPLGYDKIAMAGDYIYLFTGNPALIKTVVKIDVNNPSAGDSPVTFNGGFMVTAASSLYSTHTSNLSGNIECQTKLPSLGESLTYNSITMTGEGSGSITHQTLPDVQSGCSYISLPEHMHITYNANVILNGGLGPFDYKIVFDHFMNDVVINVGVLNDGDNWLFFTDGGAVTLEKLRGCGVDVNNNQIIVEGLDTFFCYGGKFKVHSPSLYSYIRIVSPIPLGTGNGGPISVDCDSLVSSYPVGTTTTTTTIPSNVNTIYTYFAAY